VDLNFEKPPYNLAFRDPPLSVAKVLRLDEYRERRTHRLRVAEALHRAEPLKRAVHCHLAQIAELSGADRVATVWVDEYGPGLIHPYVVLDQLFDEPRRDFSAEPLHEAWELGVPGTHDRPFTLGSSLPATLAVALGSDGTRAWFVIADSVLPRPVLDAQVRDRIMFLAGECASVVLHRDLDALRRLGPAGNASAFAGWPILEDLDGREDDEVTSARIARRFVVCRLVRMLVDDDLAVVPERVADQVRRARGELLAHDASSDEHDEGSRWHRVLDALEKGHHDSLASELVELADAVEAQGHTHGALELYACAYEIAAALGAPRHAVDAARLAGRLLRRQARWDEARHWFDLTREIADVADLPDVAARALVGLAGIKKETGNLPAARETLGAALKVANKSGDRDTIALVHHGLLGIEHAAGNLSEGLQHGWVAVATYVDSGGRMRCLASLAGALADFGDREAAEDAWTVVAHSSDERYYRIYAHDALAYLAALRRDTHAFEEQAGQCDALGWNTGPSSAKAEILYYRGLSYGALGKTKLAEEWLTRATAFAEENHYNQLLFRAEEALRALAQPSGEERDRAATPAAPPEVRLGLRAMRQELMSAGV
jgi:tetratricopeptide (TPR) repeat protein